MEHDERHTDATRDPRQDARSVESERYGPDQPNALRTTARRFRFDRCAARTTPVCYAIVKAWKGDTDGNLIFKATARNFNPMMAMAGKITIAEVEELVPAGELDPNFIHTPGIFINKIFQGVDYEKRIEQRTIR